MKAINRSGRFYSVVCFFILFNSALLNSQTSSGIIRHTIDPSDNSAGKFAVSLSNNQDIISVSVDEISFSISSGTDRKIYVSSDMIILTDAKSSKQFKAVVKSYANSSYVREEKEKNVVEKAASDDEGQDDEGEGSEEESTEVEEEKDQYEGITEEEIPVKMYLEVEIDGTVSTHDFFDKADLESIVEGINTQYNTTMEVSGSGRNVFVIKASPKREEIRKSAGTRISVTQIDIDEGKTTEKAGFDIIKLESEILKDKILNKSEIKSFTLILGKDNIYINGNQVYDKLLPKYRKIFNNFKFDFLDE